MNARNWILAVGLMVLLFADASAQQASPYELGPKTMSSSAVWNQVSYPQPIAPKPNDPRAIGPSQVFDRPPASEDDSPYVTRSTPVTRTAYQSPWSSWTSTDDPEANCGPSCAPPIGPDCNACEGDVVCSMFGRIYFRAEALALRRSHPRARPVAFDITTGAILLDAKNLTFPMQLGQRFTLGYEFNVNNAIECIFWENQNWKATSIANATNSLFLSGDPATTVADLSANSNDYQGASQMALINHSSIRSFELNYMKRLPFDKFTLIGGYRYVDFHDKLNLASTFVDAFGNQSLSNYLVDARSRLHGGQWGMMFRQRWDLFMFEVVGKGGLYENFAAQSQVVGDQNNTVILRNTPRLTKQDLAFVGEVNMNGVVQLNENFFVRFGYNTIWVDHVALAPNQLDFSDTASSGTYVNLKHGNVFMHGVNAGLEARW